MKTPANFRLPGLESNIFGSNKIVSSNSSLESPYCRRFGGRDLSMVHSLKIATLGSLFFLTACSSQPIIRVQYLPVKSWIPYPATLTAPIAVDLSNATWGSAVGDLKAGLGVCNARLEAVKTLAPPPAIQ